MPGVFAGAAPARWFVGFVPLAKPPPPIGDLRGGSLVFIFGGSMRPLKRKPVNKHRSAKKFRANARRTKSPNMNMVQRGGYRM